MIQVPSNCKPQCSGKTFKSKKMWIRNARVWAGSFRNVPVICQAPGLGLNNRRSEFWRGIYTCVHIAVFRTSEEGLSVVVAVFQVSKLKFSLSATAKPPAHILWALQEPGCQEQALCAERPFVNAPLHLHRLAAVALPLYRWGNWGLRRRGFNIVQLMRGGVRVRPVFAWFQSSNS